MAFYVNQQLSKTTKLRNSSLSYFMKWDGRKELKGVVHALGNIIDCFSCHKAMRLYERNARDDDLQENHKKEPELIEGPMFRKI